MSANILNLTFGSDDLIFEGKTYNCECIRPTYREYELYDGGDKPATKIRIYINQVWDDAADDLIYVIKSMHLYANTKKVTKISDIPHNDIQVIH